jgi:hypothetical protein
MVESGAVIMTRLPIFGVCDSDEYKEGERALVWHRVVAPTP